MLTSYPSPARRILAGLALLAGLSVGGYLLASALLFRAGFPLDDAWIHQTYARNLAWRGEWSFIPGQPSAGSTAPLWSLLLAAGHRLGLGPYVFTYLLGGVLLWALAMTAVHAFPALAPGRPGWAAWAGVLLVLEWHLVWAAVSGMETLLFALVVLAVLTHLAGGRMRWFLLGVLVGLSAWIRPDGVTLLGPAVLVLLLEPGRGAQDRARDAARLLGGTALLFVPYLLFNRLLAGAWWPNTFFAKQAEYAALQALPLWQRFLAEAGLPLVGAGALLLPGLVALMVVGVRRRAWGVLAGALWLGGYFFLYAWRLPVTYQHGRYMMPAMPVYFLWGFAGLAIVLRPGSPVLWQRLTGRVWALALAGVLVVFWGLGAKAFATDVAIIETEMVAAAEWVEENTGPGDLIAAHDIGALGYFAGRPLLDLAGLVSPDVIPFLRDEDRLAEYLDDRRADYLMTFPGWYPALVQRGSLLYQTPGRFSPQAGGENMAVYGWAGR